MAVDFQAHAFRIGDCSGLVRGLVEHGSEAKKLSLRWLIDHDLLMLLVDGSDLNRARHHDVGALSRFSHFVNALPG